MLRLTVASREIFFAVGILENTGEYEGRGASACRTSGCTWTPFTYDVDNKSCQGAITTWLRALSGKSRAFPFADVASGKSGLKGEIELNFVVTEMSFKETITTDRIDSRD